LEAIISKQHHFSQYLWVHILIGLVAGIAVGIGLSVADISLSFKQSLAEWLALPGYVFIDILKMIIVPLIISSVVLGITAPHSKDFIARLGVRIVPYFIMTTAIAISIGLAAVYLINPAQYMDQALLAPVIVDNLKGFEDLTIPKRILNLIPVNLTEAQYHSNMLQIVIFAIILGVVMLNLPAKKTKGFVDLMQFTQDACMVVVDWAIKLAPLAVFGLMAAIIAKTGFTAMVSMAAYMGTVLIGLLGVLVMYGLIIGVLRRKNPLWFFSQIRSIQLLAFSTSTSSGVMPITMATAEDNLGVRPEISRFVVPLGATINMDGTALYQGIAAVFLTQLYGIDLSAVQVMMLLLTTIGASIGTPGTPGVGLVILATIVSSLGVPAEGIGLILGVDRILDMCRTTVNVTGDLTASVVMDRWLKKT
jgi:Na+/H+-dicarboxylate symporter